ncbi:MAG: HAMP domain-containing histidine kinase [Candidatus Zambryskibacteria bacterium]|nr:HAMP domain-containing histidine kinase [Candidatus Zambryskibacteria bacterium]
MTDNSANIPISSEEYKKVTEELYKQNLDVVRLYKQVEELNQQLEIANEGQANLIHIINHQIKGYLTKARLVFDDLLNDTSYNFSEKAKLIVKQGYDSVTEGVDFVRDFLNASNIERGTFTYEMKPIDFKKIVTEQVDKQKNAVEEKGLTYELNISEGDYNMIGDDAELGQAVRNLIDNSIKYTLAGSIKIQITRDKQKAMLKIQDTGVGISDELKPKLFTKGGRDKDSQKINVNSTGFGLSFVKGVVDAHKGRVWAESEGPDKGSTFYIELPVVR